MLATKRHELEEQVEQSLVQEFQHSISQDQSLYLPSKSTSQLNSLVFENSNKRKQIEQFEKEIQTMESIILKAVLKSSCLQDLQSLQNAHFSEREFDRQELMNAIHSESKLYQSKQKDEERVTEELLAKQTTLNKNIQTLKLKIDNIQDTIYRLNTTEKQGFEMKVASFLDMNHAIYQLEEEKIEYGKISLKRNLKIEKLKTINVKLVKYVNQMTKKLAKDVVEERHRAIQHKEIGENIHKIAKNCQEINSKKKETEDVLVKFQEGFRKLAELSNGSKILQLETPVTEAPEDILSSLASMLCIQSTLQSQFCHLSEHSEKLRGQIKQLGEQLHTAKANSDQEQQIENLVQKASKLFGSEISYNQLIHKLSKVDNSYDKALMYEDIILLSLGQLNIICVGFTKQIQQAGHNYKQLQSLIKELNLNHGLSQHKKTNNKNSAHDLFLQSNMQDIIKTIAKVHSALKNPTFAAEISKNVILKYYLAKETAEKGISSGLGQWDTIQMLFEGSYESIANKFSTIVGISTELFSEIMSENSPSDACKENSNDPKTKENFFFNEFAGSIYKSMYQFVTTERSFVVADHPLFKIEKHKKKPNKQLPKIKSKQELLREIKAMNDSLKQLRSLNKSTFRYT